MTKARNSERKRSMTIGGFVFGVVGHTSWTINVGSRRFGEIPFRTCTLPYSNIIHGKSTGYKHLRWKIS